MGLGSIKSFDLHFPVCAFSRVYRLFTYLSTHAPGPCFYMYVLCLCIPWLTCVGQRTTCGSYGSWGKSLCGPGNRTQFIRLAGRHLSPWDDLTRYLVPFFESDNLLWLLSLENTLYILGISLSSYAP